VNMARWERTGCARTFSVAASVAMLWMLVEGQAADTPCDATFPNCVCEGCTNCKAEECKCGGAACPKSKGGICYHCSRLTPKRPPCFGEKIYCRCLSGNCPNTCWGPYPKTDPWGKGCSPPRCLKAPPIPQDLQPCGDVPNTCDCDCTQPHTRCGCPATGALCDGSWLKGTPGCTCVNPECKEICTGGLLNNGHWCGLCNCDKPANSSVKHLVNEYGCGGNVAASLQKVCCKTCRNTRGPLYGEPLGMCGYGCAHQNKCWTHCLSKSFQLCIAQRKCECSSENASCHPNPGRGNCRTCDVVLTGGPPLKTCPNQTGGCHGHGW